VAFKSSPERAKLFTYFRASRSCAADIILPLEVDRDIFASVGLITAVVPSATVQGARAAVAGLGEVGGVVLGVLGFVSEPIPGSDSVSEADGLEAGLATNAGL
jgi:hypothetical protein